MGTMNEIIEGDCLEVMKRFPDNHFSAIVTDPPYMINFMGKEFDRFKDNPAANINVWSECLRISKPGSYLLAFGGDRTHHHLMAAIENAGWEIRTCIYWLTGQGFPKSHNFGCKCTGDPIPYSHDKVSLSISQTVQSLQSDVLLSQSYSSTSQQSLLQGMCDQNNDRPASPCMEKKTNVSMVQQRVCHEVDGIQRCENMQSGVSGYVKKNEAGILDSYEEDCLKWEGEKASRERSEIRKESSVEGRNHIQEDKGQLHRPEVCEMPNRILGDGQERRLYHGTSLDNGEAFGTNPSENRSSSSQRSQHSKQSNRESRTIPEQSNSQDCGMGTCQKCGGLIQFKGYGTALKPAAEIIIMAMKPIHGTFAQNAAKWGQAGINIDGCRIGFSSEKEAKKHADEWDRNWTNSPIHKFDNEIGNHPGAKREVGDGPKPQKGRWPANVIFDEVAARLLDEQSGILKSGELKGYIIPGASSNNQLSGKRPRLVSESTKNSGGASRFFYCAKASSRERNEGLPDGHRSTHPTVKPLKLMEYLIRLIMPPKDGLLLDPFAGSGSTILAAKRLGFSAIGIEKSAEYCAIARARIAFEKVRSESSNSQLEFNLGAVNEA